MKKGCEKSEKKCILNILIILSLILSMGVISSSVNLGNVTHSINNMYGPSDELYGWINLSLENIKINSKIEDNQGNSMWIIKLLEANPDLNQDVSYSCDTADCRLDYSPQESFGSTEFNMDSNSEKIVGIKFEENLKDILSVNFDLYSNAEPSCESQIKVDIAEGELLITNNKSSLGTCSDSKSYGCFDTEKPESELQTYKLKNSNRYCQRIRIPEAPKIRIGAWLDIGVGDEATISLYSIDDLGSHVGECEITSANEEKKACEIDYAIAKTDDYYVCITSERDSESSIRGYGDENEGCGFYHIGGEENPIETRAFQFFIQTKMFGTPEKITVKNDAQDGNLNEIARSYVTEKYNSDLDCSQGEGCFIPIRIISNKKQTITLENISIDYTLEDGAETEKNNFYYADTVPTQVSTEGFKKIDLSYANFTMPSEFKSHNYTLSLKDTEIFTEEIIVERIPEILSLTPSLTISSFPTTLEVDVEVAENSSVSSYEWTIGELTKTTPVNTLEYPFPSIGTYNVKIKVIDDQGRIGSKTFTVGVDSPKNVIGTRLNNMQTNLDNITNKINSLPAFQKESVKQIIKPQETKDKLEELQRSFSQAEGEDDYNVIISEMVGLNIPESIKTISSPRTVNFYPFESGVDLNAISNIAGGEYTVENTEDYKYSIIQWQVNNFNIKIKSSKIKGVYSGNTKPIINVFELDVKEKSSLDYTPYLIIKDLENLKFNKNYSQKTSSGYVGIPIESNQKKLSFSTTEDVDFLDLPLFVSPSLEKVDILEIVENGEEEGIKWALFILIIFFLILIGFVIYIILQYWYKTKYEKYLFKNRNYLFNLIHYIDEQKKKNVEEKKIFKKLKKTGWNSEQINYVMKKYLGKRTGMIEIPIDKILNKFKKKKEFGKGIPKPQNKLPQNAMKKGQNPKNKKPFFKK